MRDFKDISTLELFYLLNNEFEVKTTKLKLLFNVKLFSKRFGLDSDEEDSDIDEEVKEIKETNEPNKNKEEAKQELISDLMKGVEEGKEEAKLYLGDFYYIEWKKTKDNENIKKAVDWYKKAAEAGNIDGQHNLMCAYFNGIGVKRDYNEAFRWCEKLVENGDIRAKIILAISYENGINSNYNPQKAFEILKSCDGKNNPIVAYCLGIYYEKGIGIEINHKKAFNYYKICANKGYDRGQLRLAYCYEEGIGTKKDYKKAFNRYRKAVSNGNEDAKYLLAHCYEKGIGTNVDLKKAFSIYEELSNSGHEEGYYKLAYCYEHGIGTEADKEMAFEYYNDLAKMGNKKAQFYLLQCNEVSRKNQGLYEEELKENTEEISEDYEEKIKLTEISEENIVNEIVDIDVIEPVEEVIDEAIEEVNENLEIIEDYYENEEIAILEDIDEEILFDYDLGINVFLEQTIFKQVKDNNLENDLRRLLIKIDKCWNSESESLNLNSLGFKKYEGINNKIYGFDFNNKVNDSDRIIACFIDDYAKKNDFDFDRYTSDNTKKGIILFSIVKHNHQEKEAEKVSKRINNNFYNENKFQSVSKSNKKHNKFENKEQENNMTFRAIDFKDKEVIYQEVLTKEQAKNIDLFIQKSEPFILSGIAGSGKTLSTINLIPEMVEKIKNNNSTDKILYVTFSNNLKEYIKSKVIESYYDCSEYVEIKTFEDVCTDINYKYNNKKIDRAKIITQNSYNKSFTEFLNYLHRTTRDSNILKFFRKYKDEKNLVYSEIFGILKGSMYVDWDRKEKDIVKSKYYIESSKKIVEDYKFFQEEERDVIYSITEKYNEWLSENQYYDINDIAFDLHDLIKEKSICYEYVVVDEVQDFTEVQIYLLFLLAKEQEIYGKNKTRKILLAGDPNQIINPTFFKIGRLTKLFYINDYKFEVVRLNENFRNSIKIMKMNNIVNGIINEKLPARKEEDKQDEVTKNNKTGIIELLKATDENLKIVLGEIGTSAKVALIVSDDEKKQEIKEKYGCKTAFTISEFKGKEFDNIIAYNILSDYADVYEEVYRHEHVKEGHYSYYFNRFYVSITRANYNLVLIEEKPTKVLEEIKEKLGADLKFIENISSFKDLNLGEVIGDSIELFNIGMKFFYDEKYSMAKDYLLRSMEPNSNKLAELCDLFEDEDKYEEKGDKLFEIGEYKLAQSYYEKAYEFSKFAIMYLYIDTLSYEKQLKEFYGYLEKENLTFSEIYEKYAYKFHKLDDILNYKILKTEKLQLDVDNKLNNINRLIQNINKKMN